MDTVLNTDESIFTEAQSKSNAPSRILRALEGQLTNLHYQANNLNETFEGRNFGVVVLSTPRESGVMSGVQFSGGKFKEDSTIQTRIDYVNVEDFTTNFNSTIFLPSEFLNQFKGEQCLFHNCKRLDNYRTNYVCFVVVSNLTKNLTNIQTNKQHQQFETRQKKKKNQIKNTQAKKYERQKQ